jgi:hypothetical protein
MARPEPGMEKTLMRDLREPDINKYRIDLSDETLEKMGIITPVDPRINGAFLIPYVVGPTPITLKVVAASGGGWDHVSVSTETRCPSWYEMSFIFRKFFKDTETAMELHVPAKDHINMHPYTLHLWRPHSKMRKIPMPPKGFV